jgi:hypothetical protein
MAADRPAGAESDRPKKAYSVAGLAWAQGDFNGDGSVNIGDLRVVLTNFDHTLPIAGPPGAATVPEPASPGPVR